MKNIYIYCIAILILLFIVASAWGPILGNIEQAKYVVVESHGPIELRDYSPMIVAETHNTGERKEAIKKGFRVIADYIFGNNTSSEKVAMTAPVLQQPNEKIAMTAPATQQKNITGWSIRFIMPAQYTLSSLPTPKNSAVRLQEIQAKRFATIRFRGLASEDSLKNYTKKLKLFMQKEKLEAVSNPIYAFFNPPWTLPFLRRNEVMIEVKLSEVEKKD